MKQIGAFRPAPTPVGCRGVTSAPGVGAAAWVRACRWLVLFGCLLASMPLAAQRTYPFKVVVHATNPVSSLPSRHLSRIFLKKMTRWDDGGKILPVDRTEKSELRVEFTERIHGKEVAVVKRYWTTRLFSGEATPPPELESDSEVLEYVKSKTGAIGYVSNSTPVGDGLKVVDIVEG